MANKANIVYLTKYQMMVLYYKCKEGATHEEIAAKLGRDINTVQYHMTRIYTVLEIRKAGKSRWDMESELQNEIGPTIREMFKSIDDVKIWAPAVRQQDEKENPGEEMREPGLGETQPHYIPPPSAQAVLRQMQRPPEVLQPPPPGRPSRNWRQIIGWTGFGFLALLLLIILFLLIPPWIDRIRIRPTDTPAPSSLVPTAPPPLPTEAPVGPIVPLRSPTAIIQPGIGKDGMELVHIPAGQFLMGSSRSDDPQAFDEELPQHIVFLDDYWIDKMEVSNVQYSLCVADGACTPPANNYSSTHASYYDDSEYADYPVIFVSWSQAKTYCTWAGRRLPTEAEWEKAARGIGGRIYPWGNTFDGTLLNYCDINCQRDWKDKRFDDGYVETSTVGEYPAGASMYGVLDMAGNVYEWVTDWFAPYSPDRQANPTGPDSGQDRIIRGGAWGDDPAHVRATIRSHLNGDSWMDFIGFRCAQ